MTTADPVYCEPQDVADQLGLEDGFPTSGPLTKEKVKKWIVQAESHIDDWTQDTFRTTTITEEIHDYKGELYKRGVSVPVYLDNMYIYDLDGGEGDKLEIWNGNTYEDWISTRTSGRNGDYWWDATNGIVFIKGRTASIPLGVKATYRAGNRTVPGDVTEACIKLVAARILRMDDTLGILVQGAGSIDPGEKAASYEKWAEKKMVSRARMKAITPSAGA